METFDGNIQVNRYDAEGLRHEMEENGSLVKFIFNPDREVIAEQNSLGITRYIRSSELIARNTDAARTYYHYVSDEIGSTTHIVDEDGLVLNHYTYDAWGNLTAQEEAVPNRFKFTGQQLDPVTQQYYLRARFYNPVIARFTQEDTYRGDGLNLYAYCANRPTHYIDPTGHWCGTKQDVFNKLAAERGLNPDKMDYDTKQSLMAEASNIVKERNKNSYDAAQTNILALPENIDELFTVYRGTDQYTEKLVYQETGLIMSDAARKVYFETGDINYAYEVSQKTHNEWIKIWGNETAYVQAHGSFGTELSQSFGMDRTMISVTSDRKVAEYFAGPQGIVIELQIPKSQLIPQTLPGANESEYLIVNGTKK